MAPNCNRDYQKMPGITKKPAFGLIQILRFSSLTNFNRSTQMAATKACESQATL